MDGPGDRHPNDILCLFGGFFLLLGVDPGAVFSNISHFEEILINSPFPKRVPEQRLMCPGGAGGDNHAVELFFLDGV
ncbi:hypothetical protein ES703_109702 [subsurface metagenome]